jgi:hypothetical protein
MLLINLEFVSHESQVTFALFVLDDKSEFFNQTSIDETFLNQNPLPASLFSTLVG